MSNGPKDDLDKARGCLVALLIGAFIYAGAYLALAIYDVRANLVEPQPTCRNEFGHRSECQ